MNVSQQKRPNTFFSKEYALSIVTTNNKDELDGWIYEMEETGVKGLHVIKVYDEDNILLGYF